MSLPERTVILIGILGSYLFPHIWEIFYYNREIKYMKLGK